MPLFKKGDKQDCSNYRGISLLQPLAKLYTKCVLHRLERVVEQDALRAKEQSGFKKFHKLEDNALVLLTIG